MAPLKGRNHHKLRAVICLTKWFQLLQREGLKEDLMTLWLHHWPVMTVALLWLFPATYWAEQNTNPDLLDRREQPLDNTTQSREEAA